MRAEIKSVFTEALALPPVDRAALIEDLLASFDKETRTAVDALWAKEAEERIDAYDRGELKAIPLSEAIDMMNQR